MSAAVNECSSVAERLTAYVDQMLATGDRLLVERHLVGCDACRHAVGLEEAGRALLRGRAAELLAETPLPPGLRTRCEALAREAEQAARRTDGAPVSWRARLVPIAMAVVLTIFTASALVALVTHRSDGLLAAQLSSDHTRCFKRFAGSTGADAAEMERMFTDRYGWNVRVPRSSPSEGVQLIGAKRCYYADGAVPHILYRVNGEELSLYVLDGVTRPSADLVAGGHRSRVWSRDDKTYVLVSPAASGDMTMAARYVMQEAH
jgi:anti-sigma factor RsiW